MSEDYQSRDQGIINHNRKILKILSAAALYGMPNTPEAEIMMSADAYTGKLCSLMDPKEPLIHILCTRDEGVDINKSGLSGFGEINERRMYKFCFNDIAKGNLEDAVESVNKEWKSLFN